MTLLDRSSTLQMSINRDAARDLSRRAIEAFADTERLALPLSHNFG